ncbi:hypothetical protein BBF96_08810 [Anoxybacter fermentans]|uniref:PH domain-containing protein n=1 Tax=Anoxybacter fermentans TaxID=1323375 RepID=A0A3Q9HQI7_9FIRM|nr:hypothetical protein [Anoxybacter fermentans]AZR73473.1 hypothetical protein BBF96_08810 [Anoxybacter fermentans]
MKKVYQLSFTIKFGLVVVTIISWYSMFLNIIKDFKGIWLVFSSLIVTYVTLNAFYQKIILDENGIKAKVIGYAWQKYLNWGEVRTIICEEYFGVPIYILVPQRGRAMYLSGFKNIDQLLLDIYNFAPHVILHPNVKKRIEKAKRKEQNS